LGVTTAPLEKLVFWKRKKVEPAKREPEPLFANVRNSDEQFAHAYAQAAATLGAFSEHLHRDGGHYCAAKLRLKDPGTSTRLGEDRFVFMWLAGVNHDFSTGTYTGEFFEVPKELTPWYQVGQQVQFKGPDIIDWFVNDNGTLHGGYTLRVARSRLPEAERAAFDKHTGVTLWAPIEAT